MTTEMLLECVWAEPETGWRPGDIARLTTAPNGHVVLDRYVRAPAHLRLVANSDSSKESENRS